MLMWRIGLAPNNASKWQVGFKSEFKVLMEWKKLLDLFLTIAMCIGAGDLCVQCLIIVVKMMCQIANNTFPKYV